MLSVERDAPLLLGKAFGLCERALLTKTFSRTRARLPMA